MRNVFKRGKGVTNKGHLELLARVETRLVGTDGDVGIAAGVGLGGLGCVCLGVAAGLARTKHEADAGADEQRPDCNSGHRDGHGGEDKKDDDEEKKKCGQRREENKIVKRETVLKKWIREEYIIFQPFLFPL